MPSTVCTFQPGGVNWVMSAKMSPHKERIEPRLPAAATVESGSFCLVLKHAKRKRDCSVPCTPLVSPTMTGQSVETSPSDHPCTDMVPPPFAHLSNCFPILVFGTRHALNATYGVCLPTRTPSTPSHIKWQITPAGGAQGFKGAHHNFASCTVFAHDR